MRKLIIVSLLTGLVIGGYYLAKPLACKAGQCWNYVCWNDQQCGSDCFCLLPGDGSQGECYKN